MRSPLDTNALPPDLAARFAALRAPSSPPKPSSSSLPGPTSPCVHLQPLRDHADAWAHRERQSESVEDRLRRLETPTKEEVERGVQVAVKGVPVRRLSRRLSGLTEVRE